MWRFLCHEKTCDRKVQLKYPGGTYQIPKLVELEEEGITVSEKGHYFPSRAMFDFNHACVDTNSYCCPFEFPGTYEDGWATTKCSATKEDKM